MTVLRYTVLWLSLLVLAFLNATARELVYRDTLGEHRAQQVSVVTAIVLFFAFTWLADRRWPLGRAPTALWVGLVWLVLTAGFEFVMVVVLAGRPVEAALAQYDLPSGNLWSVVLAAVFLTPLAVWALHKRERPTSFKTPPLRGAGTWGKQWT